MAHPETDAPFFMTVPERGRIGRLVRINLK
jgi:hypothetical protein